MVKQNKLDFNSKIRIELVFENQRIAESVHRSTDPENKETPIGVVANASTKGNKIVCMIESQSSLWDLITTVEDFFEKVDLSYKIIRGIKKGEL